MKKFSILLGIVAIGLASLIYMNTFNSEVKSIDNDLYIYEVTEINGSEIRGVAVTKESENNKGVFLYQDDTDLEVGDKIAITWGENNEILDVKDM